jgi:hypothetical protein
MEIWKPIKDYENYEVSNLGRVKSLNYHRENREKILKPLKHRDGYLLVVLYKSGKRKHFQIHRLVAQAFILNPENKPCINHIDCNPSNNCVSNLEWCTPKENIQYAYKLGRMKVCKENTPIIAINLTTKEKIYFNSQNEAARQLNLSVTCINYVLKGRCKKTSNYTFKYITN